MEKFIITADSGCDIALDVCKEKGIIPVHLKYSINGDPGIDSMIPEEIVKFYNRMRSGEKPMTSSANMGDFISLWEPIVAEGKPILHISMSSGISNTYQNSMIAKNEVLEEHPNARIEIIDSTIASLGMGLMVLKACQMRDEGKSLDEVVAWVNANRKNVNTLFTTSDLTYLCRGGRISKASMIIGSALGINPVMRVSNEGKLYVSNKTHGKKKTIRFIVDDVKNNVIDSENQTLYVSHSDNLEGAKEIVDAILAEVKFKNVIYSYIGATVGSHTGPGLKAIFFIGKERA